MSFFTHSVFNEKENSQLNNINNAISESAEKKSAILQMNSDWQRLIKRKCQYEIFESKGTDAEFATNSECMIQECKSEIDYFNNLLP